MKRERSLVDTDEDGFLRASRVAIWGLGLMGGSLAMALKGKCELILGIDREEEAVSLAMAGEIVERASCDPAEILPDANVVILATPVCTIIQHLRELPELHPGEAVVMDLGSTKQAVIEAMNELPTRFKPLGGHPMCGKEKSSLQFAEAGIFINAPFVLTAASRTDESVKGFGEALARSVGARPVWMNAEQHDRWVAETSHLPYLVAGALAQATHAEVAPLVGPGFRSTTRLAGSSTRMMIDILATNTENIRVALRAFREQVERYEALLDQGAIDELAIELEKSRENYQRIVQFAG